MRQSSVFTHRCQKHTPSSPTCQGLLVLRHFVVSYSLQPHGLPTARECSVFLRFEPKKKTYFALFPSIQTLNTFLLLNGGALTPWRLPNIQGQCCRFGGDSPHLFGNALAREMRDLSLEKGALLTIC